MPTTLSTPMKNALFLLLLTVLGCTPKQEPISETDVIRTIEGFFGALDVENTDPRLLDRFTTRDFMIYEAGQKMDKKAFLEMVHGTPLLETEWELGDFRVSADYNSAHASLFNRGRFVIQPDTVRMQLKLQWLESAYLVKENDSLKIRFYFSDRVGMETDTLN